MKLEYVLVFNVMINNHDVADHNKHEDPKVCCAEKINSCVLLSYSTFVTFDIVESRYLMQECREENNLEGKLEKHLNSRLPQPRNPKNVKPKGR